MLATRSVLQGKPPAFACPCIPSDIVAKLKVLPCLYFSRLRFCFSKGGWSFRGSCAALHSRKASGPRSVAKCLPLGGAWRDTKISCEAWRLCIKQCCVDLDAGEKMPAPMSCLPEGRWVTPGPRACNSDATVELHSSLVEILLTCCPQAQQCNKQQMLACSGWILAAVLARCGFRRHFHAQMKSLNMATQKNPFPLEIRVFLHTHTQHFSSSA